MLPVQEEGFVNCSSAESVCNVQSGILFYQCNIVSNANARQVLAIQALLLHAKCMAVNSYKRSYTRIPVYPKLLP